MAPTGAEGNGHRAHGWRRLLVEPRRPRAIAARPGAYWYVVGTVCIGAFMGQLDASIVTLAFPKLQHVFAATVGAVTWVGLTYLLVLVALVTPVGRVADMVGRKLLYIYGFLVFIIGSALCGLAPSLGALDAFRVLQAVGAAMLQANSVAIIVLALPREKLGRGIGIQGAAQALGLALGPTVGGLLIGLGGWRLIFFVNVPVGIVGTVLGWFLIPRSRHLQDRVRFDWLGFALFVPAVAGLLTTISFGTDLGWSSPATLGLLAAVVVLFVAFLRWERRTPRPMVDLSLFRRVPFTAGITSGLLSYLVLFGVLFVVPFFLFRAQHIGFARAGLELTVMPVALGVVAPFAGRLADHLGARPLTVAGMLLAAAALALMAAAPGGGVALLVELGLLGAGLGLFTPPNNAAIMGSAPPHQSGVASGLLNMTRGLGTAMGLSLTGLVFALVAGTTTATSPAAVTHGYQAALLFLAVMALGAMVLAALRGQTELNLDPVLSAE
ncbi:MAG TPA: DHA2 family efflux MFS transporter permease subunit [Candidatus Dormibacteraeota bacterium]|nr:DHA2 family efflux MFS transporter permease subunit [Candidatus Dormibacteraeota bacterium]